MGSSVIYKLKLYGPKRFIQFFIGEMSMLARQYFLQSYSQYKDDLIIDVLLDNKKKGFYIDVGAYDPKRFSNTMRFYRKGWKGINIEPDVVQFRKFLVDRKRDINLNIGIALKASTMTYWHMNPSTLSTFSETAANENLKEGFKLEKKLKIRVKPLSQVIQQYAKNKAIDFLSVDVEGFELEVLKSNNWKRFRPKLLCIELSFSPNDSKQEVARKKTLIKFIESNGYLLKKTSPSNYFYVDAQNL